jgi:hypothetical protein
MSPLCPKRCSRRMMLSARPHKTFRQFSLALALLLSLTLFVPGVLSRGGQGGGRPVSTPTPKKQGGPKSTGPTPDPVPVRRYRCPPAGQLSHAPQRRRRTVTTPQQGAGNANTQTLEKKNVSLIRSTETADGSRITITSDAPLNDYSAYRSGDRYYIIIPDADAPRAGGLRGRGFEDVQVSRRGNGVVISFKLQPGANARTEQRFNRIDVELTAPAAKTADANPTPTPAVTSPEPTTGEPRATTVAGGLVRAVAGRQLRCREGVWVDTAYDDSQTTNVARGSVMFSALTTVDPSIKVIAQRFSGELIVMWQGKAYRIH